MGVVSEFRFPALSETPRYQADVIRVAWEQDRDSYRRLDDVVETDVRAQRAIITWESVMSAENSDAQGVRAADLYKKITSQRSFGNDVKLEPDVDARDNSNNRIVIDIVSRGDPPLAFQTEQSTERLSRSFKVVSRNWLDPTSSTVANINDLSSIAPL